MMLTTQMPYSYPMLVEGIDGVDSDQHIVIESDKPSNWGDQMRTNDSRGQGTLRLSFKWMPLEAGIHTLSLWSGQCADQFPYDLRDPNPFMTIQVNVTQTTADCWAQSGTGEPQPRSSSN